MTFQLPKFRPEVDITEKGDKPSRIFIRWWQELVERIEIAVNGIQDALDAAGIALAAADTAQSAADTVTAVAKLGSSGTSGLTITATDAGADVTVSITAHTRLYGDSTSVSVNAGTLTGLSYSTLYYLYYLDATFAGGAVTYLSTTSEATAAQTGSTHLIGSVLTPAALAADTGGGVLPPPGVGGILEP